MNFSEKLRLLIDEENITQKQFANDLNIAPSTIGGYVQGISEPDFETLKSIALSFEHSRKQNKLPCGRRITACIPLNDN